MITVPTQIKAVMSIGTSALLLAQTLPPVAGSLDNIGRLSLDGALIIAVGVLWRFVVALMADHDKKIAEKDSQLSRKDDQLISMTTKVTEVMTSVMKAVEESRKSSDELISRVDDVGSALDNIADNFAAWQVARSGEPKIKPLKPKE